MTPPTAASSLPGRGSDAASGSDPPPTGVMDAVCATREDNPSCSSMRSENNPPGDWINGEDANSLNGRESKDLVPGERVATISSDEAGAWSKLVSFNSAFSNSCLAPSGVSNEGKMILDDMAVFGTGPSSWVVGMVGLLTAEVVTRASDNSVCVVGQWDGWMESDICRAVVGAKYVPCNNP